MARGKKSYIMSNHKRIISEATQQKPLTDRLQKFCDEYVKTCNKSQSYENAFHNNIIGKNAAKEGNRLMYDPRVRNRINQNLLDIQRFSMSADEIMKMLTDIARGKINDAFDIEPSLADRQNAMKILSDLTPKYEILVSHAPKIK